MTFKSRLLLFTLIWFLVSALVLTVLSVMVWEENSLRARQILHRDLAVHMRDDNPLMIGEDYSPDALSSIFHTLMLLGPDFEIYFLDPEGNITTSGPPLSSVVRNRVDLTPIKAFIDGENAPILGGNPLTESGKEVFSAAPIIENGQIMGYLYVVIGSQHDNALLDPQSLVHFAPVVLAALVAILLFSMMVYSMVLRRIITPGRKMVREIEQAAVDEFRVSPPLKFTSPEMQEMASQFRRMLIVIQQQFVQLRVQEAQRREYLVQLSHDLKTPLANVLGYLETWRIQHSEGRSMIDTAYHNAKRLQNQIKQQLEAAKSPSAKVVLTYRELDVERFISDVKSRFELSLSHKQLELSVTITEPFLIMADEQLLNRVFDNLMENAIRHSPVKSTLMLVAEKGGAGKVKFSLTNPIDSESHSGSLGMGGKIIDAILSLHQSVLDKTLLDGNPAAYRARFLLTAAAKSASPSLTAIPKPAAEDDAPPMDSNYPSLNAEEWQERQEPEDDPSLHICASEQLDDNTGDLPSFCAVTAKKTDDGNGDVENEDKPARKEG